MIASITLLSECAHPRQSLFGIQHLPTSHTVNKIEKKCTTKKMKKKKGYESHSMSLNSDYEAAHQAKKRNKTENAITFSI